MRGVRKINEKVFMDLYNLGWSDSAISRYFHVNSTSVMAFRFRRGLILKNVNYRRVITPLESIEKQRIVVRNNLKKFRLNNKERIKEYDKKYYQKNKNKIKERKYNYYQKKKLEVNI